MQNYFRCHSTVGKVLSIDWDYFIDATSNERTFLFPDGGSEDLPSRISDFVWACNYANAKRACENKDIPLRLLHEIPLKSEYKLLRAYLRNVDMFTPFLITESHKELYGYIHKYFKDKVDIVNIDYHHDVFKGRSKELNCGTWLKLLIEEGKTNKVTWVRGDEEDARNMAIPIDMTTDIKPALKDWYDAIFICRSRTWSPPHVDKRFISLVKMIRQRNLAWQIEEGDIHRDRFKDMQKDIESEQELKNKQIELLLKLNK